MSDMGRTDAETMIAEGEALEAGELKQGRVQLLDHLFKNLDEKVRYIHELWQAKHANGTVDPASEAKRWELVTKVADDLMKLYEELRA